MTQEDIDAIAPYFDEGENKEPKLTEKLLKNWYCYGSSGQKRFAKAILVGGYGLNYDDKDWHRAEEVHGEKELEDKNK